MSGLAVIFPMAGEGARFGFRFKPFLDFQGRSFIENAFMPFRPWLAHINKVYFVYLRTQDDAHQVSRRLGQMFPDVDFVAVVLDNPTPGPAETLVQVLAREQVRGPIIVCDCDHQLDVGGLFRLAAADTTVACALPTWDITHEAVAAWSVVAVDEHGTVTAVAEKRLPAEGRAFRGVIGCYYFADIVRQHIESGATVKSVPVQSARFFGDPVRLRRALEGHVS